MLRDFPCDVSILGIVPDDLDKLIAAIGSVEADLLVTLGGASVGDHDLVKPALERCGASLDFWKVAMRPGKPVMAGKLGDMLVIGLPGNPVSAFVTTLLFTKPAAAALAGAVGGAMFLLARWLGGRRRVVSEVVFWSLSLALALRILQPLSALRLELFLPLTAVYGIALEWLWARRALTRSWIRRLVAE